MSDLDELKSLLFGAEKQTLDSIAERVEKRETRAADIADVLPEAIHHSHLKDRELVGALKDPVGIVIRESFHEEPETYGDALYPVMGPAIRKSIMHTLRTFTQQINQAIEHSLSVKGLKWRFQAMRAGVPFGQFVMQKTLLFRVEQAYLISRENGLLISHVHHDASKIKDSDAVSAMFTAIQDFVKESFSPDRTGRLETADMGDFTLWAVHGPHALMVCVIRGLPPKSLRADLSAILERIHFRHGEAIRNYAGDTKTVDGVEEELAHCLRYEAQQQPGEKKKGLSTPMKVVIALLLLGAIALGVLRWLQYQDHVRLMDTLESTPGYYVGELTRSGSDFELRGMRDPLATPLNDVAAAAEIDPVRITASLRPFQSLDPEIVVQRAAEVLEVPEGVSLAITQNVLRVSGPAPIEWQQQLDSKLSAIPGVDVFSVQMSDVDSANVVQQYIQPPDSVTLTHADGVTRVAGDAPQSWIDEARILLSEVPWSTNIDALESSEWSTLQTEISELDGRTFYFSGGANLRADSAAALQDYAREVTDLVNRAQSAGGNAAIRITGYTDGLGGADINTRLAARRADAVRTALVAAGVPESSIDTDGEVPEAGDLDLDARRAVVSLALTR